MSRHRVRARLTPDDGPGERRIAGSPQAVVVALLDYCDPAFLNWLKLDGLRAAQQRVPAADPPDDDPTR